MTKSEVFINVLYKIVSKEKGISLPFIVNVDGVGRLAAFSYLRNQENDRRYLSDILSIYILDNDTMNINEYKPTEECPALPTELTVDEDSETDLKSLEEEYYTCLDTFIEDEEIDEERVALLFSKIEYKGLREAYLFLGAEFI